MWEKLWRKASQGETKDSCHSEQSEESYELSTLEQYDQKKSRILFLLIIFTVVFIYLLYKLFSLQIINNKNMLQKASNQRLISVPVNDLRGNVFDRNMIPLTNNDKKTCLTIIPELIENVEYYAQIISQNGELDYENVLKNIRSKRISEYNIDYDKAMNIKNILNKGIVVTTTDSRYGNASIARHVLGYVNSDNLGQYGIEKGYDTYLKRNGHQYISLLGDAFKRPLFNWGIRGVETYFEDAQSNVKLTLDYHFQNIIERTFDKYAYNGAAVLIDVKNGDVLAMVSRPNYEQNDVSKYFGSSNNELFNKALYPFNLGSIFKIIVAEAALENNTVKEGDMFFCPGFIDVDGQRKKCASYNGGGHGQICFEEAFSQSCNTAFIQIGLNTGYKNIIETARKFGLGQSLGLDDDGFNEDPGLIQYKNYTSNREIANLSIGQGDILATPLQAANLIAIVANDGIKKDINMVDSIIDDEGNVIKKIRTDKSEAAFSGAIMQKIKSMMCKVTKSGTGIRVNMDEYGGAAGKTSSAETGIYNGDEQIIHAWFGGYFPEDNPKYALAIIVENGKTGAQVAAPLFGEIAAEVLGVGER